MLSLTRTVGSISCSIRPALAVRTIATTCPVQSPSDTDDVPVRSRPSAPSEQSLRQQQRSPRADPSVWRSTTKTGPKKEYLESARSGQSGGGGGTMYDRLAPEAKRREDLRMERQLREAGPDKLYALQRERSRMIQSGRSSNSSGGATSTYPVSSRGEAARTMGAVRERNPSIARGESAGAPRASYNSAAPRAYTPRGAVSVGLPRTPTSAGRSAPISARADFADEDNLADRGPSTRSGPALHDRHASAVSRHTHDRTRQQHQSQSLRLVPGAYNASLRTAPSLKRGVEPVVRGGIRKGLDGRPKGPARRPVREMKKVVLPSTIRLENLTNLLGVKLYVLQKAMDRMGLENTRAERLLTAEDASLIALELNFDPTIDDTAAFDIYPGPPHTDPSTLPLRPPITGIFGHVDHGKTSLLDALRSTAVASGEAGGITQHIGAFEVSLAGMVENLRLRESKKAGDKKPVAAVVTDADTSGGTITFLDTPGHAAFAAMRERGAGVTDVVVLVVAADDGVKPQTEEVIRLIKSTDVGVVVALTKVDKPGIDTLKVKRSLMAAGVELEEFGGEIPCVEVSSVTGQGLPDLLETISAIAEVRELKAEREGRAEGRVIESRVEKGRGNVATVLVLRGCLRPAAALIAGTTWCRVRTLLPPSGKVVQAAYPGQPIEVTGWKDLPLAGDEVLEAPSEDAAKDAVSNRLRRVERDAMWKDVEVINEKRRIDNEVEMVRKDEEAKAKARGLKGNAVTLAGLHAIEGMEGAKKAEGIKELVMIIKADVSGTVEAVVGALEGIGNKEAKVKIILSAVGDISDSDVEMARAVEGCVVGFNVKASKSVLQLATKLPYVVPIHTSPIIYRLVEIVRLAVADLLPKLLETRVHGEASIQQIFEITVKGQKDPMKVAGCKVVNGIFKKGRKARLVRNGETIHVGTVGTLKQAKKDVLEILKGVECGIALDDFHDFQVDDVIQSIEEIEVARSL